MLQAIFMRDDLDRLSHYMNTKGKTHYTHYLLWSIIKDFFCSCKEI